jgi:hypothetical protein
MFMVHQEQTSPACTKCGVRPRRVNHWGKLDDLCDACEKSYIEEANRVYEHFQAHPDECCCETYLGRHCCNSPVHGDWWAIENGVRFFFFIRAHDRREAMAIGTDACLDNGEECISVQKSKGENA